MQLSKNKLSLGLSLIGMAVLSSCATCRQVSETRLERAPSASATNTAPQASPAARAPKARRSDGTEYLLAPPPEEHAKWTEKTTVDAGITRVDLTWNAWAEPESPTPSFMPATFLEPDKDYQLVLDLAALVYDDAPGIYSRAARAQLKDWLLKSTAPDVNLKLFIIPDERFFRTVKRTETLPIDLRRLRRALNKGFELPKTPVAMLQNNSESDFKFGRVQINLRTLDQEGMGSVAIAMWANGVMPVDELSIPLCVASTAEAAKNCRVQMTLHDSLSGIDPLRAAAQQDAFALKSDAALHFIELDDSTQIGVFRDNSWPEDKYVSWRLNRSADGTRQYLQQTLLPAFDRAPNRADLLPVGSELYSLLFPTSAREARQAFAEFIARSRERREPGNPPSIFVRMLSADSEEPPFLIPLGMMVHDIGGNRDFLGFHFRIQTPLQIQDYQPYSKCIGSWVVLAPRAGASGVPPELNDARARFANWYETWQFKPINDMRAFIQWAQQNVSETDPISLFILAHQDSNSLYFEDSPRLGSAGIERTFKTPSVAVVNGCATGAPGSSEIVQKLNERGVSAVIATAAKVDRHLAGDFFSVLGRYLTGNPEGREHSLGVAHFLTLQALQRMTPPDSRVEYGPKVLAYELMGNSSLRVCSPPRKPRRGQ